MKVSIDIRLHTRKTLRRHARLPTGEKGKVCARGLTVSQSGQAH